MVKIKDKKIRIFQELETSEGTIKQYIHKKDSYLSAYVRQLSANEQATQNAVQDSSDIEFVVNHRKILIDMLVEFNGDTYQIAGVDNFEFYQVDIKFRAYRVNTKNYVEVRWAQ